MPRFPTMTPPTAIPPTFTSLDRCAVCGYWLDHADTGDIGFGCLRGQCRYHPRPLRLFDAERADDERRAFEHAATEALTVDPAEPEPAAAEPAPAEPDRDNDLWYWLALAGIGTLCLILYVLLGYSIEGMRPK